MKKIVKLFLAMAILLYLGSCTDDYLDINEDPNSPTTPELNQLLSGSQYYMVQALSQGNFIGTGLSSYVHHLVSREVQNYGMTPGANNPYNTWNYLYTYVLTDYDAIIANAEPEDNLIYAGIARTLKAYTFSVMVDLWGDIPFTEFNVPGLTYPSPDSSKDIYNALINLLDEGKENLTAEAENKLKPGKDDFFYGGNTAKWVRLNNTIQLKLLLQSRKAKSDIPDWQSRFNALISENAFIKEGEDFQFWFNNVTNPADERHPAFSSLYGQHTHFISPYFYETMMGHTYNTTDNPFSGIEDPRVPYYFYNQLPDGSRTDTESPHEYRNGNFVSIFFATTGPNSAGSNDHSYTKYGIYPIGAKYDNGTGGRIANAEEPTGIAPHKIITYAALKFMLAELALVGETTGDASALLEEAIEASIDHVHSVVDKNESAKNPAPKIPDSVREFFLDAVLTRFNAANTEGKMRILMTQKWIHNFMNPVDVYTDYRRTGYPVFFDPQKTQDPGFGVNPTVTERSDARVPIANLASFPRSLYYPSNSEIELNPNMTQKTNLSTPFVFWDK
jgi:hypothetical protein